MSSPVELLEKKKAELLHSPVPSVPVVTDSPLTKSTILDHSIYLGASCPKCNLSLTASHLKKSMTTSSIGYYECPDDNYIAIRAVKNK